MIYLKQFDLLTERQEGMILDIDSRNIYNNYYPLHLFAAREFTKIDFDNITIFYGSNGSGKTTLLNIIAKKLNAQRQDILDKGSYFNHYVDLCNYEMSQKPNEVKKISSDDVFDYLLNIHAINNNINRKKELLSQEFLTNRQRTVRGAYESMEMLIDVTDAKTQNMSKYIRQRLVNNNLVEQSNGESALMFWEQEIKDTALYILDEPENSLAAENQIKLKQFIEDSARFYNCQFIISTHSPFLLSLKGAKIYNLDQIPVKVEKWTNLANMQIYYNFFKQYKEQFENTKNN